MFIATADQKILKAGKKACSKHHANTRKPLLFLVCINTTKLFYYIGTIHSRNTAQPRRRLLF